MARFIAFISLLILITGESITNINAKVVPVEMVPYQVNIRRNDNHICSGSIISSKFVLTTAGLARFSPEELKIQAGSTFENSGGSVHMVERIIQHSDYVNSDGLKRGVNDIALLEVNPPFKFDETLAKISLSEMELLPGIQATAVGWGCARGEDSDPCKLQAIDVPIISKEECRKAFKNRAEIAENQICAGATGEDFFFGSGGGPLVVNGNQVGISSWGATNGLKPEVYTEVAKYKSWIKNYVTDI